MDEGEWMEMVECPPGHSKQVGFHVQGTTCDEVSGPRLIAQQRCTSYRPHVKLSHI